MPCQTWQTEILCYIMSVVFENTFCLLEERRCCLAVLLIFICNKTPTAFSFRRAVRHFFFSRSIQYRLQFRHIKISRLNAWAVLAFKSIRNNPFISHSPAYANASAVKHRAGVICPVGTNAAYFESFPVIVISAHGSAANCNAYKLSVFIRKSKRKFAASRLA